MKLDVTERSKPRKRVQPYNRIVLFWKNKQHGFNILKSRHIRSTLSGPQVVHRSATILLHAVLSAALHITSSSCRFFWLISRVRVRRQVSLGLPTLLLRSGLQLRAWLGSLSSGIPRTCPYNFNRSILIFSTTLCWPVQRLSSSSLTWSYHLIFIIFLEQLLWKQPSHSFFNFSQSLPWFAAIQQDRNNDDD